MFINLKISRKIDRNGLHEMKWKKKNYLMTYNYCLYEYKIMSCKFHVKEVTWNIIKVLINFISYGNWISKTFLFVQ